MRMLRSLFGRTAQPDKPDKVVIYRPVSAVGIGHLLFSSAVYGALARQNGARFVVTAKGTVFDKGDDGADFFSNYLVPAWSDDFDVSLGHAPIHAALAGDAHPPASAAIVGRKDAIQRPGREFPDLKTADFIDRWDDDAMTPRALAPYALLYVDSVVPEREPTRSLPRIAPIFAPHPRIVELAKAAVPHDAYVAVHLRHGNGEHLHGRTEGTDAAFAAYLETVAALARDRASAAGIGQTVCLSDNFETAQRLADLTGGTALSPDDLPDRAHREFLSESENDDVRTARLTRLLVDLTILGRATRIVGGHSLFCHAAALWGDPGRLTLVNPDGSTAGFGELPGP